MPGKRLIFITVLVFAFLTACMFSQSVQEGTITQIAGNVFASQTSLALSATPTYTASPTATHTPTPTSTPTLTPTNTPLPTNTPTPTSNIHILFSDDFSDPKSGWDVYSGENGGVDYSNDAYVFHVDVPNYSFWASPYVYFSDVVIDVDAQKMGGPDDNEIGVICRMKDNDNFYLFSISSDGYYGFFKMKDGEWFDLENYDWRYNVEVINTGYQPNHITVTCNGDSLKMAVNGKLLIDLNDTDLTAGDVGLYTGSYSTGGVKVKFDDFVVTEP